MIVKLTTKDKEVLLSVKDMIDNDCKNHVSIRQTELKFMINESKLRNGFKNQYGITIFEYQAIRQLEYALDQLRNPDLTVNQAATRSGFKDISTFNRHFRKKYGITPSDWKKLNLV
jgi:AraC-like DNA-binding protein